MGASIRKIVENTTYYSFYEKRYKPFTKRQQQSIETQYKNYTKRRNDLKNQNVALDPALTKREFIEQYVNRVYHTQGGKSNFGVWQANQEQVYGYQESRKLAKLFKASENKKYEDYTDWRKIRASSSRELYYQAYTEGRAYDPTIYESRIRNLTAELEKTTDPNERKSLKRQISAQKAALKRKRRAYEEARNEFEAIYTTSKSRQLIDLEKQLAHTVDRAKRSEIIKQIRIERGRAGRA